MTPQQSNLTAALTHLRNVDTDAARVIYDALDHYLDTLIVDVREGHEPAKADMVRVEQLLSPDLWTETAAAA